MSAATVLNGCMTIPAVWGQSADSLRLEVQLQLRLYHRSWSLPTDEKRKSLSRAQSSILGLLLLLLLSFITPRRQHIVTYTRH